MSVMMRPDSGTMSRAANQRDVNKHINELQQELTRSQAETQRARDKLSCLISLVRRSWNGDRNASIHLANIVGLDIPDSLLDSGGTAGRPTSRIHASRIDPSTRAATNWERLALKLLQRNYEDMQNEIREYQMRYVENRSRYMDEVLQSHQQDMSRLPLSRPSSGKITSVDSHFLQQHSQVGPDGRNERRRPILRGKSAVTQRPTVEPAEVKLRDLFVENSPAAPSAVSANAVLAGTRDKEAAAHRPIRQDYGESKRYLQGHLFQASEILTRKPRPMSAAVLRERDQQRARPRSAVTVNTDNLVIDSTSDRPLKYETTRPVSGKRPPGRVRKGSTSSNSSQPPGISSQPQGNTPQLTTFITNSNTNYPEDMVYPEQMPPLPPELDEEVELNMTSQPPISVRVRNAITRPECVDKFTNDLEQMELMEREFKKNAVMLQKRLGLPEDGMI